MTKHEEVTPSGEQPKFTPGPWTIRKARTVLHVGPQDGHVCEVSLRPSIHGSERLTIEARAWADARLIAAAPALYEALKELRARFFEDAQAGAYTHKGKLIPLDNEAHPWIPGAKAPDAIAAIDAALALVDGPQETK